MDSMNTRNFFFVQVKSNGLIGCQHEFFDQLVGGVVLNHAYLFYFSTFNLNTRFWYMKINTAMFKPFFSKCLTQVVHVYKCLYEGRIICLFTTLFD